MTIEQLGSLGEFVAAIATIATLIYLAVQVRRNTAAGRATGTSEHTTVLNDFNYMLAQNDDLYRLYFDGLADPDSIAEPEVMKFDMLLGTYVSSLMQTYSLHCEGTLGEGIWPHHLQSLKWLVKLPGFVGHWKRWDRPSEVPFNKLVSELMVERVTSN